MPKQVYIYGDSLLKATMPDEGYHYHFHYDEVLQRYPERRTQVVNRSKMGATISKGESLVQHDLNRGLEADYALVAYGGNDSDYDWAAIDADPAGNHHPRTELPAFREKLRHTVTMLREKGIQPVLMSLPPIAATRYLAFICRDGLRKERIMDWLGDVQMIYRHQEMYSDAVTQLAYAEGLSCWLRVLDGTPYLFSDAQCAVIEKLMREGICRSIWRGVMDPSFCGRQVFIDSGPGKTSSAAVAAENIAALKRPGHRVFRRFAKRILEPENRSDGLRGPRYYDRSDCGIYRTATWYASIRMHSDRTIGFEFTNRENTLANFSADGALLFMQHGRE